MKKLLAMLLALCMMCGAIVAGAEETQTVDSGLYAFEVPAEYVIEHSELGRVVLSNGMMNIDIQTIDYSVNTPAWITTLSEYERQIQNFGILYTTEFGTQLFDIFQIYNAATCSLEDILMPNEQVVMRAVFKYTNGCHVLVTQFYQNTGFMITAFSDGKPYSTEIQNCVDAIACSAKLKESLDEPVMANANDMPEDVASESIQVTKEMNFSAPYGCAGSECHWYQLILEDFDKGYVFVHNHVNSDK